LKILPLLLALCLLGLELTAQTHPCDQATVSTVAVRRDASVVVGFCHAQQDDTGAPIALGAIRFRLVNASTGALVVDLGLLMPTTGISASGEYYFQAPPRFYTADVSLILTAEWNGLVVPSLPVLVDVRGGPKAGRFVP
jgi:hypothetical protein